MTLEYWLSRKLFHLATCNTMYKPPLIRYNLVVFHPRTLVGVIYHSFRPNRKYSQILYLAGEKWGLVCCFSMACLSCWESFVSILEVVLVVEFEKTVIGRHIYLNLKYTWVERALTKFMLTCIFCHRYRHFVQRERLID